MRILQIHPLMKSEALAPAAGGMARAALQLTRLLAERGHDVQVLPIPEGVGARELWEVAPGRAVEVAAAMHIPGWKELPWLPWAVLRLRPLPAGIKNIFYDAFALTALRREVLLFRPDIIHNHLARRPFPRLARALRLRGNLVLTHHHGEPGENLDAYDQLVFPSLAAREHIAAKTQFPRERTRVIHYPVSPVFCRAPLDPDQSRHGIIFVGAVRRRKGIDLLLDAYRADRTLWTEPLIICGRGEDEALVRQAARDGVPVRMLGQLPQEGLAKTLSEARLAVIPSRLEGFSIAVLEALCSGVPVVGWTPQISELEEVLGLPAGKPFDGRSQTAAELAASMHAAQREETDSAAYRMRLAAAARETFSEHRYAAAYLDLFREMLRS
ncbi:MAG: glycosyltransferase family 4 protein [Anaerolineales bacterium]